MTERRPYRTIKFECLSCMNSVMAKLDSQKIEFSRIGSKLILGKDHYSMTLLIISTYGFNRKNDSDSYEFSKAGCFQAEEKQ